MSAVEELSPEERVSLVRVALAEIIPNLRPDAVRFDPTSDRDPDDLPMMVHRDVPDAALWRALAVTGEAGSCWPCATSPDGAGYRCTHDPMAEPWPEVVR